MPEAIAQAPIYSEFHEDPDFRELLELFVSEVGPRKDEMRQAFESGDFDQVRVRAHQLKGAGGGYGFSGLSVVAAELEQACKEQDPSRVAQHLQAVLDYLSRVTI